MSEPTPIVIKLVKASRPVLLEKEPGVQVEYSLREMDGNQRDEFLNRNRAKHKQQGNTLVVADFKGLYSLLLGYTLYDENGVLVPEKEIQKYPQAAQEALYTAAQEVCQMNKVGANRALTNIQAMLADHADSDPALCLQLVQNVVNTWAKQGEDEQGED